MLQEVEQWLTHNNHHIVKLPAVLPAAYFYRKRGYTDTIFDNSPPLLSKVLI
jgi:hypothetical protein